MAKGLKRAPRQAELDSMIAPLARRAGAHPQAPFCTAYRARQHHGAQVRLPVLIDFGSARGQIASHSQRERAVKPGYSLTSSMPHHQRQGPGPTSMLSAPPSITLSPASSARRPSRIVSDEYVSAAEVALGSYRSGFLSAIDRALRLEVGERPQSIAEWRGALLAPEPKRAPGRLGLRLPVVRTLGRLTGRAARAAPAEPTVALTDVPQDLVPVPPDAPQPKGQLLDFIDALRKRRPPILTPRKKQAAKSPRPPAPAARAQPAAPQPKAGENAASDQAAPPREPADVVPKSAARPRPACAARSS